jgi:tryptophan-rich hypothetical protein
MRILSKTMNPVNSKKLHLSKWTAVNPRNREKHFLVTAVEIDEEGYPQTCTLEAVHSGNESSLHWRDLKDSSAWLPGWK